MSARERRQAVAWGSFAWIFILVAIGSVQFFRGIVFDGTLFFVVAAALLVDTLASPWPLTRGKVRTGIVLAVAIGAVVTLILSPRHGVLAGIVLGAVGVATLVVTWPNPATPALRWTTGTTRAAIAWASLGVLACLWELGMYLLGTLASGGRAASPPSPTSSTRCWTPRRAGSSSSSSGRSSGSRLSEGRCNDDDRERDRLRHLRDPDRRARGARQP